jgi:predicted unusual protein kinase regulating ubiquinone biosynthesis (AarF/ABC1/UbiB family)
VLQEELGRPPAAVFDSLSVDPVAAASLGQVYRGRLAGSGEDVAVKVGGGGWVRVSCE